MAIQKTGSATWQGSIKEGQGTVSTESSALEHQPYGFNTRFEGAPGTNPEELIGAAHASCFSMALSLNLGNADYQINKITTEATVNLVQDNDGFTVSRIDLYVAADIPDISEEEFLEIAEQTKNGCPISKLVNAPITLNAQLV